MSDIDIIRATCIKANPNIFSLPRFPEDSETRKAIIALEKMVALNFAVEEVVETAALHLKRYEEERIAAYIRELEGEYPSRRPIRLADVLLAIGNTKDGVMKYGVRASGVFLEDYCERTVFVDDGNTPIFWNLRADDLTQQSPETLAFLAQLLATNQEK